MGTAALMYTASSSMAAQWHTETHAPQVLTSVALLRAQGQFRVGLRNARCELRYVAGRLWAAGTRTGDTGRRLARWRVRYETASAPRRWLAARWSYSE